MQCILNTAISIFKYLYFKYFTTLLLLQVAKMSASHNGDSLVSVGDVVNARSYVRLFMVVCLNIVLMSLAVIFLLASNASLITSHLTANRLRPHYPTPSLAHR